jgi:hypothetical protein
MSMVCFSSDSRTPPRRPSIVGRMPILGSEPLKTDGFIIFYRSFCCQLMLNFFADRNVMRLNSRAGKTQACLLNLLTAMNFLAGNMARRMADGTGAHRPALARSHRVGADVQIFAARSALPDLFHRRQIAVGRARHRRVHGHGAGRADVFPIPQGQDGHGHARGRERLDVQRTRPGADGVDGGRARRRGHRRRIGTMRVTEQIDALRTLATHPVDYLVVPR